MKKRILLIVTLFFFVYTIQAQETEADTSKSILKRIFLPSIDAGYQINAAKILKNSIRIATSIEYRLRNNNDFFIRLNYDTYGARYKIPTTTSTINTIEGTVQVTDVLLGPGYRLGDKKFRLMFSVQPGIKMYDYPETVVSNGQAVISQRGNTVFTTLFITSFEYYFDRKSAFTLSLFENQVWENVDFWSENGVAYGISIGFITALL